MTKRASVVVSCAVAAVVLVGCGVGVTTQPADPTATVDPVPSPTAVTPRVVQAAPSWTPAPGDKKIYLTFDDGPWYDTEEVLDILKANNVPATFFVIGKMIRTRESIVERTWADGHVIANHSWDHIDLATVSDSEVRYQLEMTQEHIGPKAANCMRPPYGSLDAASRRISQQLGLTPVLWNRDTGDWGAGASISSIYLTLMSAKPGDVVLLHDGGGDRQSTVDALAKALPQLVAKGYTFGIPSVCQIPEDVR